MENKFLLQINRIKLQDYVQHGIIAPDKYLGDELQKDIQSRNSDFLVMSSGYFEELSVQEILLELILTPDEINNKLHIIDDCKFFSIPLPITRIKKIYAQDKNVIHHILINLANSEKGYFPKERFDVFIKNGENLFEQKSYTPINEAITIDDFHDKLVAFDKRMGMFAFMKNTNIYYSDDRNIISNYSEHYFDALSFLLEKRLTHNSFNELDILKKNTKFKNLLLSDKQIDKEFIEDISKDIEDIKHKEIFLQLISPNGIRKTLPLLLDFSEDGSVYYLIGLVYYFRQKDSNKKDNFKLDIKSIIPYEVAEISLAVLGLYLGYSNIRANEIIDFKNKSFKKIFSNKFNMKFQMDTKLDYVTIETLYGYSFYKKKGYKFKYLEYPKSQKPFLEVKRKEILCAEYIKIEYKKGLFDD